MFVCLLLHCDSSGYNQKCFFFISLLALTYYLTILMAVFWETRCTSLDKLRKLRKENNNLNIERAT